MLFLCFCLLSLISIHALREEGDNTAYQRAVADMRFLFTPSARRATQVIHKSINIKIFLFTPSARRATWISTTLSLQIWEFLFTPSARRATTAFRAL